jgi:microcystin-dependent protein
MIAPMEKSLAGVEPFIAEITIFAGNFAPRNWAFCEGQLIPISQNQTLFALLGDTYGGDGRTTFALPNLKDAEKSLNGARYIIALQGIFPSRN